MPPIPLPVKLFNDLVFNLLNKEEFETPWALNEQELNTFKGFYADDNPNTPNVRLTNPEAGLLRAEYEEMKVDYTFQYRVDGHKTFFTKL